MVLITVVSLSCSNHACYFICEQGPSSQHGRRTSLCESESSHNLDLNSPQLPMAGFKHSGPDHAREGWDRQSSPLSVKGWITSAPPRYLQARAPISAAPATPAADPYASDLAAAAHSWWSGRTQHADHMCSFSNSVTQLALSEGMLQTMHTQPKHLMRCSAYVLPITGCWNCSTTESMLSQAAMQSSSAQQVCLSIRGTPQLFCEHVPTSLFTEKVMQAGTC